MKSFFSYKNKKFFFPTRWELAEGAFFAYLCICTPVPAESFRVHQTAVAVLDLENQSASAELGINDALAVKLPKDLTFIQGI